MFEIDEYLGKIKENLPHGESELMHRPALEYLLSSMKEDIDSNVRIITEKEYSNQANNENYGTPDFSVIKDSLTLGLVENKRVGLISEGYKLFMENKKNKAQIEKYFNISNNIILTDYLNFYLLTKEEEKIKVEKSVTLCSKNDLKSKKKPKIDSKDTKNLKELFALFFTKIPESINDAKAFAKALALPASSLKDELLVLGQRDESGTIVNEYINNLYENFKKGIYEDLSFEDFADNFSQTLIYALLLGKIEKDRKGLSEDIDTTNITKFIPNCFAIINAIANELKKLERFSNLKWLIEHIIRVINHIDSATLILELNKYSKFSQENNIEDKDRVNINPFIYFYEYFIEAYNPRLRKERGVYYTPDSIVNFIINSIDSILRKHFRYEAGLSEAKKNNDITLLDFATGTGSFLLQAFYKAMQDTNIKFAKYEMDNLIRNFNGFEIMIAPYVIAHLNLALSLRDSFEYELKSDERFNVFLTNTLEDKPAIQSLFIEFQKEAESAHAIKNSKILIITGNPPYRGASSNQSSFKKEVHVAYKEPMESPGSTTVLIRHGQLYREKNPKMLLDDYVKFIRFAERKIESQEAGIFAFISNNSFLDNPTFRGMRYHLMQTFDRLYILDLHGNTRKKEIDPKDGGKDENVFDIMQGVSINIFVKSKNLKSSRHSKQFLRHSEALAEESLSKKSKKSKKDSSLSAQNDENLQNLESKTKPKSPQEPQCEIFRYDLYGKRQGKYNFLYEQNLDSIPWQKLTPKPPFYLFIPQNEDLREEYDKGWSVKDMFRISSVGVVTGKDSVFIANTESLLQEQVLNYCKEFDKNFIQDISYRPFDIRKIYYNPKIIGRARTEVMEHFLQDCRDVSRSLNMTNIGLSIPRQLKDTKIEWNHCMMTEHVVDQALTSGGNGANTIFPLNLKNTQSAKKSLNKGKQQELLEEEDIFKGQDRIENFTPEFRAFVDSKYSWDLKDYEENPHLFMVCEDFSPCNDDRDSSYSFRMTGLRHVESSRHCERSEESKKSTNKKDYSPKAQNDAHGHVEQSETSLDSKQNLDSKKPQIKFTLTPEAILGYIYAVLFHKDYREKYLDFLKIDFPKIPFVECKEKFISLSNLGLELMSVHLMRDHERERERERERRGR